MAAAEARAAWQRTANRCFVQEDAKRAPKLACCPSSSAAQQCDPSNNNTSSGQEHAIPNFIPLNWSPMNPNLPPDTKWWLQMQTNFVCQKDSASVQNNTLEYEVENRGKSDEPKCTPNQEQPDHNLVDCPSESTGIVSKLFMEESEARIDEMKTMSNMPKQPLKRKGGMEEYLHQSDFMDKKPSDRLVSKKTDKGCPEQEAPWAGNKCEPWWRMYDQDELATLVAQKSVEHIENCDLPRPTHIMHVSGDTTAHIRSLSGNIISLPSVSYKIHSSVCDLVDCPPLSLTSKSMDEKYCSPHLLSDAQKLSRRNTACSQAGTWPPTERNLHENSRSGETNPSRAHLLEALRHSQTRAREAEVAAQKAYHEKEHIVKLFFRQASHLFAHKQWLHMLQLESLCLQLRIKENQISTMFPLPWMPLKRDETSRSKRKKRKRCNFCKYVVAFAVGCVAGASLLLSWNFGWLLRCF